MKTFRWTMPEFPLFEHERKRAPQKDSEPKPGVNKFVLGVFFTVGSFLWVGYVPSFCKGVSSYVSPSLEAVIIERDLELRKSNSHVSLHGELTVEYIAQGKTLRHETPIFQRWDYGNVTEKVQAWSERHEYGKTVKLYRTPFGVSLGHWPTTFSLNGGLFLIMLFNGLVRIFRGVKEQKQEGLTKFS